MKRLWNSYVQGAAGNKIRLDTYRRLHIYIGPERHDDQSRCSGRAGIDTYSLLGKIHVRTADTNDVHLHVEVHSITEAVAGHFVPDGHH